MKIDFTKARDAAGESFTFDISKELPAFEYNGTDFRFTEPAKLVGQYIFNEDKLSVIAQFDVSLIAACARCLTDTTLTLNVPIDEVFAKAPGEDDYRLEGSIVDLTKAAMDNLVLNLPLHVLCKADCKGLCPHCGKDKNKEQCQCEIESKRANSPFAALDGVFKD